MRGRNRRNQLSSSIRFYSVFLSEQFILPIIRIVVTRGRPWQARRDSCCRISRSAKEKIQRTAVGPIDPKQETIKAKKAKSIGA